MKRSVLLLLVGVASLGIGSPCRAQSVDSLVAFGIRAYQDLDFDVAAGYFRRALTLLEGRPDTARRTNVLVYLGATDIFRERTDSARSLFQQLVRLDPRYRINGLIFPPEVTTVFDAMRRATPATMVVLPLRTRFSTDGGSITGSVFASTYHQIRVEIQALDASVVSRIYEGPIGDSLAIAWNGRASNGVPLTTGRYLLAVTSVDSAGGAARILRTPLDVTAVRLDTLLAPEPPTLLPVGPAGAGTVSSLLGGLAIGMAVTVLPSLVVSGDASPGGGRFVVGGAVAIGSTFGFLSGRRTAVRSTNRAVNDSLRAAWRERV